MWWRLFSPASSLNWVCIFLALILMTSGRRRRRKKNWNVEHVNIYGSVVIVFVSFIIFYTPISSVAIAMRLFLSRAGMQTIFHHLFLRSYYIILFPPSFCVSHISNFMEIDYCVLLVFLYIKSHKKYSCAKLGIWCMSFRNAPVAFGVTITAYSSISYISIHSFKEKRWQEIFSPQYNEPEWEWERARHTLLFAVLCGSSFECTFSIFAQPNG